MFEGLNIERSFNSTSALSASDAIQNQTSQ
jgi:hypothetical protein